MEKVVPAITYETFFKNLKCKGVREDKLVISTTKLMADVINNKYQDKVRAAIMNVTNGEIIDYEWEEV